MDDNSTSFERFLCSQCTEMDDLGFDFTMAFQPIVNCRTQQVFGYKE